MRCDRRPHLRFGLVYVLCMYISTRTDFWAIRGNRWTAEGRRGAGRAEDYVGTYFRRGEEGEGGGGLVLSW